MSPASTSNDDQMLQHCDEIFALRDRLRKDPGESRCSDDDNDDDDDDDSDDGEDATASGSSMIITPSILESTIVPAMKGWLKLQDEAGRKNAIEEKKDSGETQRISEENDGDNNSEKKRLECGIAILDCLVSFAAATCVTPPPPESPTQQSSYNSLSFRRSTTTATTTKTTTTTTTASKKRELKFSSDPKEDKALFVRCGAFEMAVSMLRKVLEHHVAKTSSSSWSRHKRADLDTFDSIGVADSSADVKIESVLPENDIPARVMRLIACLTHNASDSIKSNTILPHLANVVHKSMMVFLPSPEVQAYGCWTLHSLSNPLLQELIAAGSVSVLVRAMKCHPSDARVQEHGNKSLYNLLPLLVYCTNQKDSGDIGIHNETNPNPRNRKPVGSAALAVCRIEIDGEQLEDYSSLLPGLPAIVLRGMEIHPEHLAIQQYGLLVLMRLCQREQEFYEVIISEGGLMAILQVVTMATTGKLSLQAADNDASGYDDPHGIINNDNDNDKQQGISEKYDCLAQMACQFLRDVSRPTNSSMDILRIIAVKGGIKTVLKLLDHYNQENLRCGGGNSGMVNYHGSHQRFAIINIIDPAMACLRNLMTNEDNRAEVMTFLSMAKTMQQQQIQQQKQHHQSYNSNSNNPYGDEDDDGILVCANLIPIVLKTMEAYPLDSPIQAYGCDLMGRLAQGEHSARVELIHTTIDPDAFSADGRTSRNLSRLWKTADDSSLDPTAKQGVGPVGSSDSVDQDDDDDDDEDAEIVDLSDQMSASVISTSPRYRKNLDVLVTTVRAMRNHRHHLGVQERAVMLILSIVVDRDTMLKWNGANNASQSSSSYYLIQRLQEVYEHQREKDNPATFLAFLQSTPVPPKGAERLKTLIRIVELHDRKKSRGGGTDDPNDASNSGPIGKIFRGWNKLAGGGQQQ